MAATLGPAPDATGPALHLERVEGLLQDRFVGSLLRMPGRSWRLVHLETGTARLEDAETPRAWTGPALLWLPWRDGLRLKFRAGAAGTVLALGDRLVASAIGHRSEAAALRIFAERPAHLALAGRAAAARRFARCLAEIRAETVAAQAGAETIIEAELRVILVTLWRLLARPDTQAAAPAPSRLILLHFRQLLETHFRERWPVARYCARMNVSADRLHHICTRHLGRPPKALIQDRTGHEAQILLQRSHLSLDQIAAHLGFASAAQFNAFFRRLYGLPPGAYRKREQDRAAGRGAAAEPVGSYADWP